MVRMKIFTVIMMKKMKIKISINLLVAQLATELLVSFTFGKLEAANLSYD